MHSGTHGSKVLRSSLVLLVLAFNIQVLAQSNIEKVAVSNGNNSVDNTTADYYAGAYKIYGTPLRLALHNIIKGHTSLGYDGLYNAYPTTDAKPNNKVWDMYSDVPNGTPQYTYTHGSKKCGNYSGEGDCYNREHSWCDSWLGATNPARADLFHVYPTDGYVNNRRSNYPFGVVGSATYTSSNGSKVGNCVYPGYSGTVFEPINEYKGDFARSAMYMSVRYYLEDGGFSTSPGTNKSNLLDWYANLMFDWSVQDTVSTKEINRNSAVFTFQHNRNPFIDHPEFAAEIWKTTMPPAVVTVRNETINSLVVDFSRYVDSAIVTKAVNFTLDRQIGSPISVQWGINNDVSKVLLTFAQLATGTNYTLTINNLKSINGIVMKDTSVAFRTSGPQSLSEELRNEKSFLLAQNFPNPFNPTTEIRFQLRESGLVSLKVFDVMGNQVTDLLNSFMGAGEHQVTFNAAGLSSGIYYYQMKSGNDLQTMRMMILK